MRGINLRGSTKTLDFLKVVSWVISQKQGETEKHKDYNQDTRAYAFWLYQAYVTPSV